MSPPGPWTGEMKPLAVGGLCMHLHEFSFGRNDHVACMDNINLHFSSVCSVNGLSIVSRGLRRLQDPRSWRLRMIGQARPWTFSPAWHLWVDVFLSPSVSAGHGADRLFGVG